MKLKTNNKVIYLGSLEGFESTKNILGAVANVVNVEASAKNLSSELQDAIALLDASMQTRITNLMVDAAPNLRIISCATTGSDHIERDALSMRGIPVRTLREDSNFLLSLTPAAELSWLLLMACARQLPSAINHVLSGEWKREMFPGMMLNGRRLGLIGCGRIGSWMSRYARAFGMDVIGYDPNLSKFPETIQKVSLEEVYLSSDFISIHVHLMPETTKLIDKKAFSLMKQGVVFINTSRGGLVDESAMLEALKSGKIGSAGIDVLDGEPDINSHVLVEYARSNSNLLITPHCGGFSPDAVKKVCALAAEKIRNHIIES
jgi:phosphoglycerate dehydrogenase-like enzyme